MIIINTARVSGERESSIMYKFVMSECGGVNASRNVRTYRVV